MTKYTDDQINEAVMLANQTGKVYVWETEMYRNVIKHLPDQQDDWQECGFADIRKGDRVKRVKKNPCGTLSTIEGHATSHDLTGWGTHDHYLAVREDDPQSNITLYRIPAPVQHPNPLKHPVIIDSGDVWFWNPHQEMYQHAGTAECRLSEGFTNWGAAEVIATEPAEVPVND